MKITNLGLQNIRSYGDESINFPKGTMLVHGENGAGKTTLLMSIFGGLFLSKIRNVGSNEFNLDDIVRRGERKGKISLTFEIEEIPYTVTWNIDTEGSNSATLESPALEGPVSGIRDVRSEVINIVGMDEDSFSSSVYVQQGEIDRLFDDEARAELIDDLLGLDRIDRYRIRMKGARRAASRLVTENEQAAQNHHETIEEEFDYDIEGYESQIADIEDDISETEAELQEVEEFLDELEDAKNDLEATIEEYDELTEELEAMKSDREELLDDRADEQRDIEEAETAIKNIESEITTLEGKIDEKTKTVVELGTPATADPIEIDLSTEEAAKGTLAAAQDVVEVTKVAENEAEASLEQAQRDRKRLVEERDELVSEQDDLNEELSSLEEEAEDVESAVDIIGEDLGEAKHERNEATEMFLPEKICPVSIEDNTQEIVESRVDKITSKKNTLSEERAAKTASLEAAEQNVDDVTESLEEAEDEIVDLEDQVEQKEDEINTANNKLDEARTELNNNIESLEADLDTFGLSVSADELQSLVDDRIPSVKTEVQSSIDEANSRVTELATQKSTLEDDRDEMESLDGVSTCPKCGQEVAAEHVENELDDIEAELNDIGQDLAEAKANRDSLIERRDELDTLRQRSIDLRSFRKETVDNGMDHVETLSEELEDIEEEITEATAELNNTEQELAEAESTVVELCTEIDEIESKITDLEYEIEEGEAVLEAFDHVEELDEKLEEQKSKLDDFQSDRKDIVEEISETEAEIENVEENIEAQHEAVTDAESKLEVAKNAVSTAEQQRELVSDVVDAYDEINEFKTEIEGHRKDINHGQEKIEALNSQINDAEIIIEDLEEEIGEMDVEESHEKLEAVNERIAQREETVAELEDDLELIKKDRTVLENELERLKRFHERLSIAEKKREWAQDREEECNRMISVYQSTKSDLREQYLAYINEYTNDIFSDIYKNSSYQQVRILEEGDDGTPYAIQLLRDDGTLEHPSNASGGERAIVNLALRAGIYKFIAEMREGNTGRLPPFILDEPTTFLDDGHVGRLDDMLESISGWDVPQVIVVSHDERLIQGAEHEMEVSINEDTNASQVDLKRGGRTAGDD